MRLLPTHKSTGGSEGCGEASGMGPPDCYLTPAPAIDS